MFGITVVPSILLALGMTISPESPRWLFQVILPYYAVFYHGTTHLHDKETNFCKTRNGNTTSFFSYKKLVLVDKSITLCTGL